MSYNYLKTSVLDKMTKAALSFRDVSHAVPILSGRGGHEEAAELCTLTAAHTHSS